MRVATALVAGGAVVALASGCASAGGSSASAPASASASSASSATAASVDPSTPTGWGPTVGELDAARTMVASWTPEQLAGQVIVGRWSGTDPAQAASMVESMHLAGVQLNGDNIVDEAQVRATNTAVTAAFARTGRDFPPVIGVDQEGGSVSHLEGITTALPAFAVDGQAVANGATGAGAVQALATATGLELRDLGFTWDFAPVADVTIGAADVTIGDRSASSDPQVAARTVTAAVDGFNAAGVVSTLKHFPGHGRATVDSHQELPQIDASMADLRASDLVPFVAGIKAGAPAVMVGHLNVTALAPGVPTSLAPQTYTLLRDGLGFEGVAITDSLGMGAVTSRDQPEVEALNAGADLLLRPADTPAAYQQVTTAIQSGKVPRARAEDAAARVVALQRWQQRAAAANPVPADASAQSAARVQELYAAASGSGQ